MSNAIISSNRSATLPSKSLFCDFQYDHPPTGDFPLRVWNKLIAKHGSVDFKQSSGPEGSLSLRKAIAAHLTASRGIVCDSDQIIIVNGTQQGLDLAARVLSNPNDTVAIEEAHYSGAREVFQAVGARLLPVPLDKDGMRVMDLAGSSKKGRITLVYVTPSHQMPTGAILSMERRTQLLEWAIRNDAYILEDDYDGEYRYDGLPLQSLQGMSQGQRVIYFGSFSRSISPTIRIGYIVAPPQLARKLQHAKWLTDRHSPLLIQEVLAEFINEGHFERHLRRVRGRNYRRRTALLEGFAEHFGDAVEILGRDAGVHVLARFHGAGSIDLPTLISRVAAVGVSVYPVTPFYLRPVQRCELLFGYGALREESIREGLCLFHSVFQELTIEGPSRSTFRPISVMA
jgi:GntR family transcriptional regulator/MocR family aminotransferase